jgi:hypothetical protein
MSAAVIERALQILLPRRNCAEVKAATRALIRADIEQLKKLRRGAA